VEAAAFFIVFGRRNTANRLATESRRLIRGKEGGVPGRTESTMETFSEKEVLKGPWE